MNILITGNPGSLAGAFAQEFVKQNHRVVIAAEGASEWGTKLKNTTTHAIHPARDVFREAMSSYGFDIVVFIATREEQLHQQADLNTGQQLDALRKTLELARYKNLKRFFFISSTEVFGASEKPREESERMPASINGHALTTGEQYCRHYQHQYGLNVTIVRVPYVYGPKDSEGFLFRLIQDC